jgi:hypothetical protein
LSVIEHFTGLFVHDGKGLLYLILEALETFGEASLSRMPLLCHDCQGSSGSHSL